MLLVGGSMKKILSFLIVGVLLISSIVSVGVIADNQKIRAHGIIKSSDDSIDRFFAFLEEQENLNPTMKNFLKHATAANDGGMIFPGYYYFAPCDPIDIEGVGVVGIGEEEVAVALLNGTINLDNTFSHEYNSDEIVAAIIFYNFSGEIEGGPEEGPVNITGYSEEAVIVEISLLAFLWMGSEHKRRNPISVIVFNLKEENIEMVNPHFYIYDRDGEEYQLVYDELIQTTWEIPPFPFSKTWVWDQKDYGGNTVPLGDYVVVLAANINGNEHPFNFNFKIIQNKERNMRNLQLLIHQILEKIFSGRLFTTLLFCR
jgi:hypothetical protein